MRSGLVGSVPGVGSRHVMASNVSYLDGLSSSGVREGGWSLGLLCDMEDL